MTTYNPVWTNHQCWHKVAVEVFCCCNPPYLSSLFKCANVQNQATSHILNAVINFNIGNLFISLYIYVLLYNKICLNEYHIILKTIGINGISHQNLGEHMKIRPTPNEEVILNVNCMDCYCFWFGWIIQWLALKFNNCYCLKQRTREK